MNGPSILVEHGIPECCGSTTCVGARLRNISGGSEVDRDEVMTLHLYDAKHIRKLPFARLALHRDCMLLIWASDNAAIGGSVNAGGSGGITYKSTARFEDLQRA